MTLQLPQHNHRVFQYITPKHAYSVVIIDISDVVFSLSVIIDVSEVLFSFSVVIVVGVGGGEVSTSDQLSLDSGKMFGNFERAQPSL